MYFDVSKLYFSNHIINDSLSDGSKGYFANTLTELIDAVENEDHSHFGELLGGDWSTPPTLRFKGKCGDNEEKVFNYFYFVEYPKFFRPYKWEERHLCFFL